MTVFRFSKWFFDAFSISGEYFFLFITRLTVFGKDKIFIQAHGSGRVICQAELELAECRDDAIITRQGSVRFDAGQICLKFRLDDFQIAATWEFSANQLPASGSIFEIKRRTGLLTWKPLSVRSRVNGFVNTSTQSGYVFQNENGYCDKVTSTFLPFLMPVRELWWGRLHAGGIDLAFTLVKASGTKPERSEIFLIYNGIIVEFDKADLVVIEQTMLPDIGLGVPVDYVIEAENSGYRLSLHIKDHRIITCGNFMNDVQNYSPVMRKFLAVISKNPRGVKSVATADIRLSGFSCSLEKDNLALIDEFVVFGG